MRSTVRCLGFGALLLAVLPACRPDQIEHLKESKQIGIEAENWQVKRIMPADLLRATRWAGDSLTRHADRELRRVLSEKLQAGGVAAALPYCRPETYASVDSLEKVLQASSRRLSAKPRNPANQAALPPTTLRPDTARQVARPSSEVFTYQRPILLTDAQCLRCHGEVGKEVTGPDYALIRKAYPRDQATGYRLGDAMGVWSVSLQRAGVAEFWTMKTRKIPKRHKLF